MMLLKKGLSIHVDRKPFPECIAVLSENNEKYVRSEPDDSEQDNLLQLPREK